jgi:hypothetical protein
MVIQRIIGWVSIVMGLLFIISFPSVNKYTPDKFAHAAVIIGIFLIALGIFLVKA